MGWEDCFLRLDPYNFDTEEEYERFNQKNKVLTSDLSATTTENQTDVEARLESTAVNGINE